MALENDTQAPDFDLANQFGEHVRLSDFRGVKPVALVFFPLAFSSTCTGELRALRDNLSLFKEHGVELIGISVDSKATLRAWATQEGYDFTLLADFWPTARLPRSTASSSRRRATRIARPSSSTSRASFVHRSSRLPVRRVRSRSTARRSTTCCRSRLGDRACRGQPSRLTARAITSARITNPANASNTMSIFARCESGIASVGLNAIESEAEKYR